MTIVNDNSGVVNKPGASLTDDARFAIYDHHMFIAQATERPLPRTNVLAYTPAASVTKTKKIITLTTVRRAANPGAPVRASTTVRGSSAPARPAPSAAVRRPPGVDDLKPFIFVSDEEDK